MTSTTTMAPATTASAASNASAAQDQFWLVTAKDDGARTRAILTLVSGGLSFVACFVTTLIYFYHRTTPSVFNSMNHFFAFSFALGCLSAVNYMTAAAIRLGSDDVQLLQGFCDVSAVHVILATFPQLLCEFAYFISAIRRLRSAQQVAEREIEVAEAAYYSSQEGDEEGDCEDYGSLNTPNSNTNHHNKNNNNNNNNNNNKDDEDRRSYISSLIASDNFNSSTSASHGGGGFLAAGQFMSGSGSSSNLNRRHHQHQQNQGVEQELNQGNNNNNNNNEEGENDGGVSRGMLRGSSYESNAAAAAASGGCQQQHQQGPSSSSSSSYGATETTPPRGEGKKKQSNQHNNNNSRRPKRSPFLSDEEKLENAIMIVDSGEAFFRKSVGIILAVCTIVALTFHASLPKQPQWGTKMSPEGSSWCWLPSSGPVPGDDDANSYSYDTQGWQNRPPMPLYVFFQVALEIVPCLFTPIAGVISLVMLYRSLGHFPKAAVARIVYIVAFFLTFSVGMLLRLKFSAEGSSFFVSAMEPSIGFLNAVTFLVSEIYPVWKSNRPRTLDSQQFIETDSSLLSNENNLGAGGNGTVYLGSGAYNPVTTISGEDGSVGVGVQRRSQQQLQQQQGADPSQSQLGTITPAGGASQNTLRTSSIAQNREEQDEKNKRNKKKKKNEQDTFVEEPTLSVAIEAAAFIAGALAASNAASRQNRHHSSLIGATASGGLGGENDPNNNNENIRRSSHNNNEESFERQEQERRVQQLLSDYVENQRESSTTFLLFLFCFQNGFIDVFSFVSFGTFAASAVAANIGVTSLAAAYANWVPDQLALFIHPYHHLLLTTLSVFVPTITSLIMTRKFIDIKKGSVIDKNVSMFILGLSAILLGVAWVTSLKFLSYQWFDRSERAPEARYFAVIILSIFSGCQLVWCRMYLSKFELATVPWMTSSLLDFVGQTWLTDDVMRILDAASDERFSHGLRRKSQFYGTVAYIFGAATAMVCGTFENGGAASIAVICSLFILLLSLDWIILEDQIFISQNVTLTQQGRIGGVSGGRRNYVAAATAAGSGRGYFDGRVDSTISLQPTPVTSIDQNSHHGGLHHGSQPHLHF